MSDKVKHSLLPTCEQQGDRRSPNWPEELKVILGTLIDLSARVITNNGHYLALNEILTADELAVRFKVPVSTVEELARRGKLPGAFRVGKHWRFDLDRLRSALPIKDDDTYA